MPDTLSSPSLATGALRDDVEAARERAFEAHRAGEKGTTVARGFTATIDAVLAKAWEGAQALAPLPGAALVALGGYGRKELSPYSDVDLMLLVPDGEREAGEGLARVLFTTLWDARLEPGSALRTPTETAEAAARDHTITTALLDGRVVAGDAKLGRDLLSKLWDRLRGDTLEKFVAAKRQEMAERRGKFGGSVYLLEPNVKTGVGGLRDLATALWIFRARHRAAGITGVARLGFLPRAEVEALRNARDFILRVRCQLHLQARRRDDRLTFVAQTAAAQALGYVDAPGELAVERFMRDFYVAAQAVEQASDALVDRCTSEAHLRRRPIRARALDDDLEAWDDRVTFTEHADIGADRGLCVRLFTVAERENLPVHSYARDRVATEVNRDPAAVGKDPRVVAALLEYLQAPGTDGTALDGLFVTGVLGSMFEDFARQKGRVQHDVYHVYTVDTHTLFALKKLLRLRSGELAPEQPVFSRLAGGLPRPLPIALGTLFHDLGKGLGGDHSKKGEVLLRSWAAAAGLSPDDVDDAAFLVREHLRLSQVAFRRDLSDPQLVQQVATLCGTRERLDMLYLLTYVDISSVGPETWNDWRSRLLADLYDKVLATLDGDGQRAPGAFDLTQAAVAGRAALHAALGKSVRRPVEGEVESFLDLLPERYLATVAPVSARAHFEAWRVARSRPFVLAQVAGDESGGAQEVVVAAEDRPGLLALVAGVFAAHGVDIESADLFSLKDGRVLDAFVVRGPQGLPPGSARLAACARDAEDALAGKLEVLELLRRRRSSAALSPGRPEAPLKVRFDLAAARDATVVDVFANDRPGLLHDIAFALHEAGTSIVLARIATEGNRAADGFYVRDLEGRKITDRDALARIERLLVERLANARAA